MKKKLVECNSEQGITIGIIDSIINSLHLLNGRSLDSQEVREALKDLYSQEFMRTKLIESYEFGEEFWKYPDRFVPINDIGYMRIQYLYGRYCAMYLLKMMPIFFRAYEVLSAGMNFTEGTSFGEMSGDRYLWVEKHDKKKVMVLKEQSHSFIYIKDGSTFHIRKLKFGKESSDIKKLRKQDFDRGKFTRLMAYADNRDEGHVFSADYIFESHAPIEVNNELSQKLADIQHMVMTESPTHHTVHAIEAIVNWEYYLDDPDELT